MSVSVRPLASVRCSRCGGTIGATRHQLCAACLLRLATAPASRVPAYEIVTLLGAHDDSTTYLARGASSGALLVVRTFNAKAGGGQLGSLEALAAWLHAFRHPNVAVTHGVDVDPEGTVSLVRDFVQGRAFVDWAAKATVEDRAAALGAAQSVLEAAGVDTAVTESNIVINGGVPIVVDLGVLEISRILGGAAPR